MGVNRDVGRGEGVSTWILYKAASVGNHVSKGAWWFLDQLPLLLKNRKLTTGLHLGLNFGVCWERKNRGLSQYRIICPFSRVI